MKINYMCILLLVLISEQTYSQEESPAGFGVGEIYVGTRGLSPNEQVSYKMEAVGSLWGGGPLITNPPTYFLNPTNPSYITARIPRDPSKFLRNTIFTNSRTDRGDTTWHFFRMIVSHDTYGGGYAGSFGYGLYKFYVEQYSAYFYIDYRDANYSFYSNCPGGECNDIWVKYERSLDKFFYMPYDQDTSYEGIDPDHQGWIPINNGELLFYYKIKNQTAPRTDLFPNYWQNCLVVIPKKGQDEILVPNLVWGPIPNFQADGYKIYWSLNTQGGPPGNFSLLSTVNANTYEYTHEGLAVNGNWKAYYKVKSYNSSTESGFTNTAEIGVGGFFKDKGYAYTDNNNEFTLLSNYPNPFNPTTVISWQLPVHSHVTLKVYDILGREVATLIDEVKEAGVYNSTFSIRQLTEHSTLSTGVYFYELKAGDFRAVKKMLLIK